jgi:hypothetical protein
MAAPKYALAAFAAYRKPFAAAEQQSKGIHHKGAKNRNQSITMWPSDGCSQVRHRHQQPTTNQQRKPLRPNQKPQIEPQTDIKINAGYRVHNHVWETGQSPYGPVMAVPRHAA